MIKRSLVVLGTGLPVTIIALIGVGEFLQPSFDGQEALQLVKHQIEFGPRVPGSESHTQTLEWMESLLKPLASVVQRQPFTAHNPWTQESVEAVNLIASFYPEKSRRIMLCAHWDSRPVADAETPEIHEPIDGAVDGASGTAVLLQLAVILAEHEPAYGIDLVFFDAEDLGVSGTSGMPHFFQGSRYFASIATASSYKPWFAILVDLIGDRDAEFYREELSLQYAPDIVEKVWKLASTLGIEQFKQRDTRFVYDDHWILNKDAGIPAINITEGIRDYPYWHTLEDTFDKVGASSLEAVGKVLVALIYP